MLLASEDAQATREEVETVNEEFQATNEELETLNEELTASVEELRVANEDLATRTDELSVQTSALEKQRLNLQEEHDRLRSILASLGDAVVAVDHEGRIVADQRRLRSALRWRARPRSSRRMWPACRSRRPSGRSGGPHEASDSEWNSRSPSLAGPGAGSRPWRAAHRRGSDLGRSAGDPGPLRADDAAQPGAADGRGRSRAEDAGGRPARRTSSSSSGTSARTAPSRPAPMRPGHWRRPGRSGSSSSASST